MSKIIKILIILYCSNLPNNSIAYDNTNNCNIARHLAEKFLKLESEGKRLGSVKEYRDIMDYTIDRNEQGDEPGWDSVNLIEYSSYPKILSCSINKNSTTISVKYIKVGSVDGWNPEPNVCYYASSRFVIERLFVQNGKINGIGIYKPYVSIDVLKITKPAKRSVCKQ